jgi:methionyl aminopeptidase
MSKISIKTDEEIKIMKEGVLILRKVVDELIPKIDVGWRTEEIDAEAERLIRSYGAEPSFKTVKGYHWSTCLPVNEQAVHTPPSKRELKDGDIITLDIGVLYKEFHTDFAYSKLVGTSKDTNKEKFLKVGQETLDKALKKVAPGVYLGEIAEFIETEINKHRYFILKELIRIME